jgi:4-hydroxy-tetrahydrodipicolinate synthase
MERHLRGILPVLQIPFDAADDIDENSLRREVDFCIAAGAHGLVVPALASEFVVLTDQERQQVVEIVANQIASRVPLVVGISATSTKGAIAFGRHARGVGAAAVMAVPPYVRHPDEEGIVAFYVALADTTDLSLVVQNAAPPFGMSLSDALLGRLLEAIAHIHYVKEERPPAGHHISQLLAGAHHTLRGVFGGAGGLYLLDELTRGAVGCMPSAAFPDVLVAIYKAFTSGDHEGARVLYHRLLPALNLEMSVQMALSKEVLRRRGVFTTTKMRDPQFPRLDHGDQAELDVLWPGLRALSTL